MPVEGEMPNVWLMGGGGGVRKSTWVDKQERGDIISESSGQARSANVNGGEGGCL